MNRKLVGGLAALVVVVVAIWVLVLRDKDDVPAAKVAEGARSAVVGKPAAAKANAEPVRGGAVRWQLDREPEGPLLLEGQVLGPDGKAVAGAEVRLDSVPARTGATEDDGTFQFDKLVGRSYTLVATSGELAGSTVYKLTDQSDPAVIRLVEGVKLQVVVTDEAAAPIANATVRARNSSRSATTDANGEATLSPLEPGWIGAQAVAEGYAPGRAFTTIGSGGATGRLAIVLRKGFAVSGRVVDEAGKPVAKARVTLASAAWGFEDDDDDYGTEDTLTDGKGQFKIAAVVAGSHGLVAVDGEHAPGHERITVVDRPLAGVEIVVKAGGRIAGHVVDADRKPVPFATVRVAGAGQQMFAVAARQSTTDKHGAFEVRGLVRTKLAILAESNAAASAVTQLDLGEQGTREGVELVLDQTGTIAGVVVDEQGAPIAETSVQATPDLLSGSAPDALLFTGVSTTTTDGAGAFTIRGLPPGHWRLHAAPRLTREMRWRPGGTAAKTGDQHVKITLATPGSIRGRLVVAGSNQAPAFAMVQIGWQPPTPTSEGVFTLREVEPGEHQLTVRGPAFANHEQRVTVVSGKVTDLGTITLQRGRRVVGKVVDATGAPVPDAKVRLGEWLVTLEGDQGAYDSVETQQGIRSTRSRPDGSFELVGVPQKASTAMASHATLGSSPTVAIPEGTEDPPPVTITLAGFGSITGVVTSKGKPLPGVTITLTSKGGGRQMSFAQTDPTGTYKLTKVAQGAYTVQAMRGDAIGASFSSESAAAEVVAGKQSTVNIDIPVGNISLLVKLEPLPGAKIDLVQTFLFRGSVAYRTGKQVMESFAAGGAKGMKMWMGKDHPMPELTELEPGSYSICSIPLTGKLEDPAFQRQLQEHADKLRVYCKGVNVGASPVKQTVVHQLPSMDPLPDPK